MDSWGEHQRQHDRFTVADREFEEQVTKFSAQPLKIRHFIVCHPSGFPIKGAESREKRLRRGAKIVAGRMALMAIELHHTYQFGSRCPTQRMIEEERK